MTPAFQYDAIKEQLVAAAREIRHHAYAPYSSYMVGAAVCTDDGRLFAGANVENASYGLTVCAERVAIFRAVSEGARAIRAIAVVTRDVGTPCGACRQVLMEFGREDTLVWCASEEGTEVQEYRLADLLPNAFNLPKREIGDDELILGGA